MTNTTTANEAATDKQRKFIIKLVDERGIAPGDYEATKRLAADDVLTKTEASRLIDYLTSLPVRRQHVADLLDVYDHQPA